jgi:beta-lactamase regulating signal transducer with metallopeptidase domain/uncharacterized GH25 family protein
MVSFQLLDGAASALAQASWQAGLLVVLVLAISYLFRRIPARWQCLLWAVVLARLLLPVVPPSPTSLLNVARLTAANTTDSPPAVVAPVSDSASELASSRSRDTATGTSDRANEPEIAESHELSPVIASPSQAAAPATEATPARSMAWFPWAILVLWLLGVLAIVPRSVAGLFSLHALLQRCRHVNEPAIVTLLERCRGEMGVNGRVELLATDFSIAPAVAGVFRHRILVSREMLATLGEDQLRWLLLHELAHVRRRDVVTGWLWWLARTLHWFNPLVWWAAARARLGAELACDEAVLARTAEPERAGYGRTLLRVAELLAEARPVPGTVGAMVREPVLSRRIKMIVASHRRSRIWTWFAAAILIVLASVGLTGAVEKAPEGTQQPAAARTKGLGTTRGEAKSVLTAKKPAERTMHMHVVDPDGRPVPGAKVFANVSWKRKGNGRIAITNTNLTTDDRGEAVLDLPKTHELIRIWVSRSGYPPLFAQWWPQYQTDGHILPKEFTFKLSKGTVIGGVVKDEAGRPIEGVKVEVQRVTRELSNLGVRLCVSDSLAVGKDPCGARRTDRDGRWTLDNVPEGDDVEVRLMLNHPNYISDTAWGNLQKEQDVTMNALRDRSAVIVLHKGFEITGRVTDPSGKPVAGAVVVWGDNPYMERGSQEVRTDAQGVYRFPALRSGPMRVTVMAKGWRPDEKKIEIAKGHPPVDFQLQPGKTLRIRFVDPSGKPIPDVGVGIGGYVGMHHAWRGADAIYNNRHPNVLNTGIPDRADRNGVYEWTWAPADEVTYTFWKGGYQDRNPETLAASDRPYEIVMQPERAVTGKVVDAATGKPIEAFRVEMTYFRTSTAEGPMLVPIPANPSDKCLGQEGVYRLPFEESGRPFLVVRIEADGYEPVESKMLPTDKDAITFDAKLSRSAADSLP